MAKLFLTSSFADAADVFEQRVHRLAQGKTVAFIPTASKVEDVSFYVDKAKLSFDQLGIDVHELDIATADKQDVRLTLERCDYIYLSGGNTFYLLQQLRATGADQWILNEAGKGKVIIGESAGSIVMAPSINYVAAMDDSTVAAGLSDYTALNLVDFYPVPHSCSEYFQPAIDKIVEDHQQLDLRLLTNQQALEVTDNNVALFDQNSEVN